MVYWRSESGADITIGETKVSYTARILLIILIALLIITGCLTFYFRKELYDYIVNPDIILPRKEVTIEVFEPFKANDYIINEKNLEVNLPNLNTSKLGSYTVTYKVNTSTGEKEHELKVNIVDTKAPELELSTDLLIVEFEDKDSVNPKDYIKSYKDNYDKNPKISYPNKIENKSTQDIKYIIEDSSGNKTAKTLKIVLKPEVTTTIAPTPTPTPTPEPRREEPAPVNPAPVEKPKQPEPIYNPEPPTREPEPVKLAQPFISGVQDISVKVGTSPGELASLLTSGVYGSGSVSVTFSGVNTTVPGSYTAYYTGSDGATASCMVTVYE